MKINWLSNAPYAATGYGNQTKLFAPRIKSLGHDITITAFYGLEGGTLEWNGIPVLPRGREPYGMDITARHAEHVGAQVIISLMDAWVCDAKRLQSLGAAWIPWFPIDMEPLPSPVKRQVEQAHKRIVFSRFGERQMHDAGLDCYYVPHGVETDVFRPIDRAEARRSLGLPEDVFIVGMVAANKGNPPRKAFFQQIEAFAEFHRRHPDSLLYLHTQAGNQGGAHEVNLVEFCEYHGLKGGADVRFAHPYQLWMSYPDPAMVEIYNAMDVHMLVSMGEGFGIPTLEAQACGTPVITSGWTASEELCFGGWKIDKREAEPTWTPLGAYQYTPHAGAIVDRLEAAYRMRGNPDYRKRARAGALAYDADKVTEKYWRPVLNEIEQSLEGQGAFAKLAGLA
jgi:glycosyltransferase involved in cell wall biosynthesis